jgi:hypothetical protein
VTVTGVSTRLEAGASAMRALVVGGVPPQDAARETLHAEARDAAETEEGRHESDHQKNDGPVKQANSTRPFAPNPYVSRLRELL